MSYDTTSTAHAPTPWRGGDAGKSAFHPNKPKVLFTGNKEDVNRAISCVNACDGINPEAVPELLAACEIALGSLNGTEHKDAARHIVLEAIDKARE